MRNLLLASTALLALSTAPALADTVVSTTFNIDHCTNGCGGNGTTFGTLTLTDTLAGVDFVVSVAPGTVFNLNGAFAQGLNTFNFNTNVTLTAAAFTFTTPGFAAVIPAGQQDGFGVFANGVDALGQGTTAAPILFSVAGLNLDNFIPSTGGDPSAFFTIDVQGANGNTGLVGAQMASAVPEASTWAMMLLGFAGIGTLAYRRRQGAPSFRLV